MTTLLHPKAEVNNAKIHTYIKKKKLDQPTVLIYATDNSVGLIVLNANRQ